MEDMPHRLGSNIPASGRDQFCYLEQLVSKRIRISSAWQTPARASRGAFPDWQPLTKTHCTPERAKHSAKRQEPLAGARKPANGKQEVDSKKLVPRQKLKLPEM